MKIYMEGKTYGIKDQLKKTGWAWNSDFCRWEKETIKTKDQLVAIFTRKYDDKMVSVYTYDGKYQETIWNSQAEINDRIKTFKKTNAEIHDEVFAEAM